MYRAVFYDQFSAHKQYENGWVDENVIGYFDSIQSFKQAVLERWTSKRDRPVFVDETPDLVRVNFQYLESNSNNFIILRRIEPIGFRYAKENRSV